MYRYSCVHFMLLSRAYISHHSRELSRANTTLPMLSGLSIVSLSIVSLLIIFCACVMELGMQTIHNFVTILSQQHTNVSFPNNFVTIHNISLKL